MKILISFECIHPKVSVRVCNECQPYNNNTFGERLDVISNNIFSMSKVLEKMLTRLEYLEKAQSEALSDSTIRQWCEAVPKEGNKVPHDMP